MSLPLQATVMTLGRSRSRYRQTASLPVGRPRQDTLGWLNTSVLRTGFSAGFYPLNRSAGQRVGGLLQVPETLVVLEAAIQPTAEMLDAPSAKSQNDNAELMATVGKGISRSRGMVAVELAAYEAVCLKCF